MYPGTWGPWTPVFFLESLVDPGLVDPRILCADLTPGLVDPGLERIFKIWTQVFPENLVDLGLVDPGSEK